MIITHSHKKIAENRQAKPNLFSAILLYINLLTRQAKPNLVRSLHHKKSPSQTGEAESGWGSTHITKNPTNQTGKPILISGIFPPSSLHCVDCQSGGVSGCGFHGLLRLAGVNAAIYRVFYSVQKQTHFV